MDNKVWWKSKIIWLSVATIIVSASEYIAVLEQYIPQHYQGLFTSLTGILIVIARVYSNKELTATSHKPKEIDDVETEIKMTKQKPNIRNQNRKKK